MSGNFTLSEEQKSAIEKAKGKNAFALFMPTGTGKTLTSLLLCQERNANLILVVGPLSSAEAWEREGKLLNYKFVNLTEENDIRIFHDVKYIFWINYDNLDYLFKPNKAWLLQVFKKKGAAIIIDESHYIKNIQAQRTRMCLKLRWNFKYAFLLSATPSERYEELYSQFLFLIPDVIKQHYKNYPDFKEKHLIIQEKTLKKSNKKYKVVTGYKDIKKFIDILMPYYYSVTKKIKEEKNIWIECPSLNKNIKALYREYENFTHAHIASSGFDPVDKEWFNTEKIQKTIEIVENCNEPVVIFANFIHEAETLAEVLNTPVITGETEKDTSVWKGKVLVCTYALSESVDLTKAHQMIFFSYPLAWKKFYQAKGRINRLTQKKEQVRYYFLYSEADKPIIKTLLKKQDVNMSVLLKQIDVKDNKNKR